MEHIAAKVEEILKENDRLHIRIEQMQAVGPVGMTEWSVLNSYRQYVDKLGRMVALLTWRLLTSF